MRRAEEWDQRESAGGSDPSGQEGRGGRTLGSCMKRGLRPFECKSSFDHSKDLRSRRGTNGPQAGSA